MRLVWPHDDPSEGCEQRGGIMRVWYKICPGPGSDAGMQNWLPIVRSPPPLLVVVVVVVVVVVTMSSSITSSEE